MNFLESLGTAKATGLAVLVWGVGLFLALAAANEASIKANDRTRINLIEGATPARLAVREDEVTDAEYQKVVEQLDAIHPEVAITIPGQDRRRRTQVKGIQVSVEEVGNYYNFIIVLYDIMTAVPDARWRIETLCAGTGCDNNAYVANVRAFRKQSRLVEQ